MTTSVVWASTVADGHSALYIGADSRFSWKGVPPKRWDFGTKLFFAERHPDIFGYVGHASFGIAAITQLCTASDSGALRREKLPGDRAVLYWSLLDSAFSQIPPSVTEATTVLYCTRDGEGKSAEFSAWELKFPKPETGQSVRRVRLSNGGSTVAREFGTGAKPFRNVYDKYRPLPSGATSRAVYWALSDAICSGKDDYTGGAPQLTVLGARGNPKPVGVLHDGVYYLLGLPLPKDQLVKSKHTEWRDKNFTMIDPITGKALSNAQQYVRDKLPD